MIRVIHANERYFSDRGWLQSYFLLSFDDYYDPDNVQFGALRAFNDDVFAPGRGFPMHPHSDMEIITIPLAGAIIHTDSMGNETVIKAGDVQRMSAGTGLTHSEMNKGREPVHLYQIWILPDTLGLPPSYDQRSYSPDAWHNRLFPVASGQGFPDVVTFATDATIYRAGFDAGHSEGFETGEERKVFIYIASGELRVNETLLSTGEQGRIEDEQKLDLMAVSDVEFTLIDVPS